MNSLGLILLLANLVIMPVVMLLIKGPRGVVLSAAIGWLVLSPRAGVQLPGLPLFNKDFSVSYALLIGILLFRGDAVRRLRFRPIDIPMLMWVVSPFISSIVNGLGPWDACSELYMRFFFWGVPYLAGRTMVRSLEDIRECAIGVMLAGLIAVPLCLIELRLSPVIHRTLYGIHPTAFHMAKRLDGYRPMLNFRHGIEVGVWMACASIVATWFAITSARLRAWSVPVRVQAGLIVLLTVLCRSLGAIALLFGTLAVAIFTRTTRLKLALLALVLAAPVYLTLRATNVWSPDLLADLTEQLVDANRADSFRSRLEQEVELGRKAGQRRWFGWGGHNRFRVFDDFGEQTTVVDALWLIAYGKNGLLGLAGLYGMLCIPAFLLIRSTPARLLTHQNLAGIFGLILALMIATADSLQNAFFSPLMMISAGALATAAVSLRRWLSRPSGAGSTDGPPTVPAVVQPVPSAGGSTQ